MNDRLELLGDVTWWQWSKIDRVPLVRTSGALSGTPVSTFVFNFDDTFRLSIGANYRLDPAWMLKFGVAYDQTPVKDLDRKIMRYIKHHNLNPKPLKWKYADPSRRIRFNSSVSVN